jgi:hypothetical protein
MHQEIFLILFLLYIQLLIGFVGAGESEFAPNALKKTLYTGAFTGA